MQLDKIKYTPILIGLTNNLKTISWTILINSKEFSYSQGLGYLTDLKELKKLDVPSNQRNYFNLTSDDLRQVCYNAGRKQWYYDFNFTNKLAVVNPKLTDVLWCLFLDAYAHETSFNNWCLELGYDTDSIKAKQVYDSCTENYFKLKEALGQDYNTVKTYIDSLNL